MCLYATYAFCTSFFGCKGTAFFAYMQEKKLKIKNLVDTGQSLSMVHARAVNGHYSLFIIH